MISPLYLVCTAIADINIKSCCVVNLLYKVSTEPTQVLPLLQRLVQFWIVVRFHRTEEKYLLVRKATIEPSELIPTAEPD